MPQDQEDRKRDDQDGYLGPDDRHRLDQLGIAGSPSWIRKREIQVGKEQHNQAGHTGV